MRRTAVLCVALAAATVAVAASASADLPTRVLAVHHGPLVVGDRPAGEAYLARTRRAARGFRRRLTASDRRLLRQVDFHQTAVMAVFVNGVAGQVSVGLRSGAGNSLSLSVTYAKEPLYASQYELLTVPRNAYRRSLHVPLSGRRPGELPFEAIDSGFGIPPAGPSAIEPVEANGLLAVTVRTKQSSCCHRLHIDELAIIRAPLTQSPIWCARVRLEGGGGFPALSSPYETVRVERQLLGRSLPRGWAIRDAGGRLMAASGPRITAAC